MRWERWLFVGALMTGALFRLPQLDLRPMHTDEAVHAVKFGTLLETGVYRYDRHEYHGPTLNYLTLVPAWVSSEHSLAQLTETTLRIVLVVFGLCLILSFLLVRDVGWRSIAVAAALTACSPAMVFYSRYYIQETLLVSFAFCFIAAAYRLLASGRLSWAVLAGLFAGLMFATKETWLISFGAMGMAVAGVAIIRRREGVQRPTLRPLLFMASGISFLAVAVLFYSSFFTNWAGVLDSVLTYETYFSRAGENARHGHPWYYFLQILSFSKGDHGPVWSEAVILALGSFGVWKTFTEKAGTGDRGRDLRLFLGIYALLMLVISSAIPYKTPWLVLGSLQPLIIMAGYGMVLFLDRLPRGVRLAGTISLAVLIGHLAWQAYLGNFVYYDDPVNPYVYSHPTKDVEFVGNAVTEIVRDSPEGTAVQVVFPGNDYWPLPWYLRKVSRVGWWDGVGDDFVPAGIILASPEVESAILTRLYEKPLPGMRNLYVPLFNRPLYLRPGKEMLGYIALDVRDRLGKERLE